MTAATREWQRLGASPALDGGDGVGQPMHEAAPQH